MASIILGCLTTLDCCENWTFASILIAIIIGGCFCICTCIIQSNKTQQMKEEGLFDLKKAILKKVNETELTKENIDSIKIYLSELSKE